MKQLLTVWVAGLLLLLSGSAFAQQDEQIVLQKESTETKEYARPQNFGIGIALGVNWLNSDVQDNGTFFRNPTNPVGFGALLSAQYTFLHLGRFGTLGLMGEASLHSLEASAEQIASPNWDPYKVTNTVIDFHLGLNLQLFPKSRLRPAFFIGLGFLTFDPKIETSDRNRVQYAQYLNNDEKSSLAVPAGVSLTYTASSLIDVFLRIQKTFTFSDNLDGFTSEINDNYPFIGAGLMFYFGGKEKQEEEITIIPPPPPVIADTDGDGLNDTDEKGIYGTDPNNKDTDGDRLIDGDEVKQYKTDPLNKDTDGDRLIDGDEVLTHKTDPLNKDTDGDGCIDGDEVLDMKTEPLKTDTDGDGLSDCDERNIYRTNPLVKDTDGDGADDGTEVKNGTDPLKADVLRMDEGGRIVLEGINFETNKAVILPESEEILQKAYNTLRTNPTLKVEIGGHTDDVGNDAANQKLSDRRAKAVVDYLSKKGIDAGRMAPKGYGEKQPLVPNTSVETRAKNRRIEFKIISK
ncbi:MAG: OmpA family protein [Ignavibacteria bacterium]|nr:OmpA family protein [Ignavibacteria bacterium]